MSDETYLLQRIMGLETELSYYAESSRQQQFRHNTELSRLQNDNRKLQARLGVLQAENNTLRVQLKAGLSVISYLEQRLKFHLKSLLEQEATARTTGRLEATRHDVAAISVTDGKYRDEPQNALAGLRERENGSRAVRNCGSDGGRRILALVSLPVMPRLAGNAKWELSRQSLSSNSTVDSVEIDDVLSCALKTQSSHRGRPI